MGVARGGCPPIKAHFSPNRKVATVSEASDEWEEQASRQQRKWHETKNERRNEAVVMNRGCI